MACPALRESGMWLSVSQHAIHATYDNPFFDTILLFGHLVTGRVAPENRDSRVANKEKTHMIKRRDKQNNSSKTKRDSLNEIPTRQNIAALEQIFGKSLLSIVTKLPSPFLNFQCSAYLVL